MCIRDSLVDGPIEGIQFHVAQLIGENALQLGVVIVDVYKRQQLQSVFPQQLGDVELDTFYRAINKVQPSLIRTEADQMTYDLHVMIRFDLELALLEGTLALNDLPEAWRARYQSDLGIASEDDRDGVLQDVHWFAGVIVGAFQCYTMGNIMSALF